MVTKLFTLEPVWGILSAEIAFFMLFATTVAPIRSVSGKITANSSPPKRAATSVERLTVFSERFCNLF